MQKNAKQNNVGKNTRKLYISTAIVAFMLVLAISLALVFTLGGRSSGGTNNNGENSGKIGSVSTKVYDGTTELSSGGLTGVSTGNSYNVNVKNNSDVDVYLRARVIVMGTSNNLMIKYGANWTYAADNYLYYNNKVSSNKYAGETADAPTTATDDTLFKGFDTTTTTTGLTVRFVVEALQKDAALPNVKIDVGTTNFVNGETVNSSASDTLGTASCTLIQNGLKKYAIPLSWSDTESARTLTITNNGKQDLDVKFRISSVEIDRTQTPSSEWMVEGMKIDGTAVDYEFFQNAGYYQLKTILEIGKTVTIVFGDSQKANGIAPQNVNIDLTLQDYIVATDVYSLVDATTLQNVGEYKGYGVFEIPDTLTADDLENLAIYSYNNINKFVYVKTTSSDGGSVTYNGTWGKFEGESTGISSTVIAPKSCSAKLFATATASKTYTIKVWTAQTIDNPTISVIKATSGLNDATGYYQPVTSPTCTQVTTASMILEAGTTYTATNVTEKWANLAVMSNDSSDMLVRISLSFAWGAYDSTTGKWTQNSDALGFSPSVFYGNGFSFNSEDQSLTYNYNLAKGQATSALLEFPATASSETTATEEQQEFAKMINAINTKYQALKLSVMVEAIYAVGSQLDVLKIDGEQTSASENYYTTDELGTEGTALGTDGDYISMTKTSGMITGSASELASSLSQYVVYVTNNFPVGVRIAVALQWGTLNGTTWTPSTNSAGANSSVNLGQYLDSSCWTFDSTLGGYNYKCSIPGKCASMPIFSSSLLKSSTDGLVAAIGDEATTHGGEVLRVIIMAETTHNV